MKFENLFGMGSGYVLDFSNRTFQEFILSSVGVNIWDETYSYGSGSKANRLRAFIQKESDNLAGRLLSEMLEYWKTKKIINNFPIQPNEQILFVDCKNASNRLLGKETNVQSSTVNTEDEFINKEFKSLSLEKLGLESAIINVLNQRLDETRKCLQSKSPLAVIFLCGSTLEGLLLGIALQKPQGFNESRVSPKDKNGKVLPFHEWSLSSLIDAAHSLSLLDEDVKKFSHALRDFRNYIHPYEQTSSGSNPSEHTAKICWQVLQAGISQLSVNNKRDSVNG